MKKIGLGLVVAAILIAGVFFLLDQNSRSTPIKTALDPQPASPSVEIPSQQPPPKQAAQASTTKPTPPSKTSKVSAFSLGHKPEDPKPPARTRALFAPDHEEEDETDAFDQAAYEEMKIDYLINELGVSEEDALEISEAFLSTTKQIYEFKSRIPASTADGTRQKIIMEYGAAYERWLMAKLGLENYNHYTQFVNKLMIVTTE